jgi:hypothetical protein
MAAACGGGGGGGEVDGDEEALRDGAVDLKSQGSSRSPQGSLGCTARAPSPPPLSPPSAALRVGLEIRSRASGSLIWRRRSSIRSRGSSAEREAPAGGMVDGEVSGAGGTVREKECVCGALVGGDGGGGIWSEIMQGCFYKRHRGQVIRVGGSTSSL